MDNNTYTCEYSGGKGYCGIVKDRSSNETILSLCYNLTNPEECSLRKEQLEKTKKKPLETKV